MPSLARRESSGPQWRTLDPPENPELLLQRSHILQLLLQIDHYARLRPDRRIALRNRTRESITRQLHYERDPSKLERMRRDAEKLLALWKDC